MSSPPTRPSGQAAGQPLAGAEAATRREVMHVLLDELRRNLCIESEFLTEEKYDAVKRASAQWLKAPWTLSDETGVYSGTAYPGGRSRGASSFGGDLYVSGLGLYGRWLRRLNRFPLYDQSLKPKDADAIIDALFKVMVGCRNPRSDQGSEQADRVPDQEQPDRMALSARGIPCTGSDPREPD